MAKGKKKKQPEIGNDEAGKILRKDLHFGEKPEEKSESKKQYLGIGQEKPKEGWFKRHDIMRSAINPSLANLAMIPGGAIDFWLDEDGENPMFNYADRIRYEGNNQVVACVAFPLLTAPTAVVGYCVGLGLKVTSGIVAFGVLGVREIYRGLKRATKSD